MKASGFPSLLAIFLTLIVWLTYQLKKNAKPDHSFWEKENQANFVRKKPLDELHYITIPLDTLPFFYGIDENLEKIQSEAKALSLKTIVNLTCISNTDLKLMYGAGNLELLSDYDQNFTLLARLLFRWGTALSQLGYTGEAIQVLEFGIDTGTDITGHYILLANLYQETLAPEKIDHLIECAGGLNTLLKDKLLNQLMDIRYSYPVAHISE